MFVIYSSLHIFSDLFLHFSEPTKEGKRMSEKRKKRKEKKKNQATQREGRKAGAKRS
jgi:hypothetical protein